MILLDYLNITHGREKRTLELWQGDLTQMPPAEAVNILVVSAFPNNYVPAMGTLIGALSKKGVSVQELSQDKQTDLRDTCSCWLSKKIHTQNVGIQFEQILCFEPSFYANPADMVGGIFRSLAPFIIADPHITQVAMPLVSTGNVGWPLTEMVEALFSAAVGWLENGLPLERLKIVEFAPLKAAEIKGTFALLKRQYQQKKSPVHKPKYDVFISYSHENSADADFLTESLKDEKSDIHIFLDRQELQPGVAWQEAIHRSIDDSRKVMAVYSPPYIKSPICQEEFNLASILNRRTGGKTLFPILLYETELLPHMAQWHFQDCKFGDRAKMKSACHILVQELG